MVLLEGHGHSFEIAKHLSNEGILIGIDRDEDAIEAAKEKLKQFKNIIYVHDNHDNIKQILEGIGNINYLYLPFDKVMNRNLGFAFVNVVNYNKRFTYIK